MLKMPSIKIFFMFSSRTIVFGYSICLNSVYMYTHMYVNGVYLCFCGAVHVCIALYVVRVNVKGLPQSLSHKSIPLTCI